MIQQRKKRNSSKVNLTISVVFHTALILAVFFFAAREGMLGKKLKQITVTMVPKEKKPEPPKEKPPEPKVEQPKVAEAPKPAEIPQPRVETAAAPPPVDSAPAVAPAAASLPAFEFSDGAKDVQVGSNPIQIYGGLIENAIRSRWTRPAEIDDGQFVAEVQVSVDGTGQISNPVFEKGSGNPQWDNSVREAIAATKSLERPPPKGFPEKFIVRFDVQSSQTEPVMQLGSR
jgi:periplasmic protein TonB